MTAQRSLITMIAQRSSSKEPDNCDGSKEQLKGAAQRSLINVAAQRSLADTLAHDVGAQRSHRPLKVAWHMMSELKGAIDR